MQITDGMIEAACRAALLASRPGSDPDSLTPLPRGQVGTQPLWQSYARLVRPAVEAAIKAAVLETNADAPGNWRREAAKVIEAVSSEWPADGKAYAKTLSAAFLSEDGDTVEA